MKARLLNRILLLVSQLIGLTIKILGLVSDLFDEFKSRFKAIKNVIFAKRVLHAMSLVVISLASPLFLPYLSEGIAKNSTVKKSVGNSKTRALKEIEEKSAYLKRKIAETKAKEKIAIHKLTEIQSKLYQTQRKLRENKSKLSLTQYDLSQTEEKLIGIKSNYSILRVEAENRIRQIYQGQRLRILEVLLKTPNLTDFLDTLYYQKLLIAQDKDLLENINRQSREIESYKERLAEQKIKIANVVGEIERQKSQIAQEHNNQTVLVRRLRTERGTFEQAERQLERESQQLVADINRLIGKGSQSGGYTLPGTGVFAYPLRGRLTSPFGMRRHPMFKVVSFHSGVDLAAPLNTPIMASDSGKVIFTGWYGGYGKVVIVDHGKDYSTLYAHLNSTATSVGRTVSQGDVIGYEGRTGYSTGPHLHFEVRKSGRPQNPMRYLR